MNFDSLIEVKESIILKYSLNVFCRYFRHFNDLKVKLKIILNN